MKRTIIIVILVALLINILWFTFERSKVYAYSGGVEIGSWVLTGDHDEEIIMEAADRIPLSGGDLRLTGHPVLRDTTVIPHDREIMIFGPAIITTEGDFEIVFDLSAPPRQSGEPVRPPCTIKDLTIRCSDEFLQYAIFARYRHELDVDSCKFRGKASIPIDFLGVNNSTISNNDIRDVYCGMKIYNDIDNVLVISNQVNHVKTWCYDINGGQYISLVGNTNEDSFQAIYYIRNVDGILMTGETGIQTEHYAVLVMDNVRGAKVDGMFAEAGYHDDGKCPALDLANVHNSFFTVVTASHKGLGKEKCGIYAHNCTDNEYKVKTWEENLVLLIED